jgi:ABC-2 type transport system ATP-binding protein
MSQALTIHNLKKIYPTGTEALKDVSLSVDKGGFYALLGPNGAGKTTLISVVAGLTDKTSGTVEVFGENIDTHRDRAKSHIGLVPQEMNFSIFEKVINIVCTQAGYYGIARSVAYPRAEEILKNLGLWEKRNDKAQTLSGGMKRRLMIARALIHDPELLILDEPTAGVDVELRRGMWDFLRDFTARGKTIILTTHYLEEAEQLADRAAIINKGLIVAQGTVKELLASADSETFVIDLGTIIGEDVLQQLHAYKPERIDNDTLEITASKIHTLGRAVSTLENHGTRVLSMRPKGNRLEELFISLVENDKE